MRKVLIVMIVVIALLLTGLVGFMWFDATHFFVDGKPYPNRAQQLDLREEEVTPQHYLAVQQQLPDCLIIWNVPLQGNTYASNSEQLTLFSLAQEDMATLTSYFPMLKRIDATACKEYALLETLAEKLPDCQILYQVDLGGTNADPHSAELTLAPGSYTFDTLLENLAHLPALQKLHFTKSELTLEQMAALEEAYPEIAIGGTVELLGKEYDTHTTALDLSTLTSKDVEETAAKLSMLSSLKDVELMTASGTSQLTMEDVKTLQDAAPQAVFHYVFDFYGFTISTTDTEVILQNVKVDADSERNIRRALDIMENCERFVWDCRRQYDMIRADISSEMLAQVREDYRHKTKFVWRVWFGDNGSSLTDAQVLRAVYGLQDDNASRLQYLEDVRYMDIGHNEFLDYANFISGMKSLEAVIISGAPIKSLEPFAACKNLKFLEMADCHYVPDLEPLKECTQLEMLNISYTNITDISPLEELNLTHLNTIANKVPEEQVEAYMESHPNCWTVIEGNHYGVGWRYAENGIDLLDWYSKLDAEYHYISQRNIPNNVGWYLD